MLGPTLAADYARILWHGDKKLISEPTYLGQLCNASNAFMADNMTFNIDQDTSYWFFSCGGPVMDRVPSYNKHQYRDAEMVYPSKISGTFLAFSALGKLISELACSLELDEEWDEEFIEDSDGCYGGQWFYKDRTWYIRRRRLAKWYNKEVPKEFIYACANSYPLHAYRGYCRGVSPKEFLRFRAEQQLDAVAFLRELKKTISELRKVPWTTGSVVDLRDKDLGPLVHEASLVTGFPILQQVENTITISNLSDEWLKAFVSGDFFPADNWQADYLTKVATATVE